MVIMVGLSSLGPGKGNITLQLAAITLQTLQTVKKTVASWETWLFSSSKIVTSAEWDQWHQCTHINLSHHFVHHSDTANWEAARHPEVLLPARSPRRDMKPENIRHGHKGLLKRLLKQSFSCSLSHFILSGLRSLWITSTLRCFSVCDRSRGWWKEE